MRQRAISAALLVPVLLIVLAIGGVVLAAAVALVTVLAAIEVFRLLQGCRLRDRSRRSGSALPLSSSSTPPSREVLEGSGLLLIAVGDRPGRGGRVQQGRIRATACTTWMATVFGAFYVSLLGFILRLGHAAPEVPADAPLGALGAERGWILLLIFAVWSYDTGAYLVGKQFGRTKFLTHISPSKTYAGLVGGVVASTIVVAVDALGPRPEPAPCPRSSAR